MQRCLDLAIQGKGHAAPNPLVGCVIVHKDRIIGEGYHEKYGSAHAEVNAIASVQDKTLLHSASLYVNLEPCAHFGKTPPCADLIVSHSIPHVIIGCADSFELVGGRGIAKLVSAGIDVKTGVLEKECRELNKRFFTFHEKKRPYVILKWAETADGFTDMHRTTAGNALQISSPKAQALLHTWRSEEQAILVGTRTALLDNPRLTARTPDAKNPLRLVIDRKNKIPTDYHLKDQSTPTLIFTEAILPAAKNLEYIRLKSGTKQETLTAVLSILHDRGIQSLLVEGGTALIDSFQEAGIWDEARVFISPEKINGGVGAPSKQGHLAETRQVGKDELRIYKKDV